MYNILVISKELKPFEDLISLFKRDFFNVYTFASLHTAISPDHFRKYDFILLHLEDNDTKHIELIKEIKDNCSCPLYVFSKTHSAEEASHLLEAGSEGHIEIPFSAQAVAPRIKAVLRFLSQLKKGTSRAIRYGRLSLNIDNREILIDDRKIPLTNVEFKIVHLLIEHREMVVTKDKIIHYVWDENSSATDNALGIHITRLRKKLVCKDNEDLIETVWGLGYRLNLEQCE
ncbi:MAG TPA: response regulator transcription factor [Acholeplasmataceae bacterium]|jgi:DNA-binding response OmpR family regulator|nr:response regulator transcription factor [Acholeplasmataceae bacterium]